MQRLLPVDPDRRGAEAIPLDPAVLDALVAGEERPGHAERPWVVVNMVATADGATEVDGVSGPIGGAADFAVFTALRAAADVILAGSSTVTAERYRPPRGNAERQARRVARGQAPLPRLAVVSNRGDLDLTLPMFTEAGPDRRPIVLVADGLPPPRRDELEAVADVLVAGGDRVDVRRAVQLLGEVVGARVVLAEGGTTLNGLLLGADLVDEWCITISPQLVAGNARRAAVGAPTEVPRRMRLVRAFEHDGELLLRYVRDLAPEGGTA